ncbi:hypothetical protein ASF22_16690 [Methylobacterium sp. Leaf87]|nr:hypothetical protein ASF22_16690 [Methylobacterium sp. Leaf87]
MRMPDSAWASRARIRSSATGPPPTMAVRRSNRPRRVWAPMIRDRMKRPSRSRPRPATKTVPSQTRE